MLVSGMILGTLFTLFVVPSIYMLVARAHAPVVVEEGEVQIPQLALIRPKKETAGGPNRGGRTGTGPIRSVTRT